ncbi:MAG: response regulator, partial [Caldilineae bacterium]
MEQRKILVVDDVPDWREQLQDSLQRSGYEVETASSYEEAVQKIRLQSDELGLVIVDLRLDPADEENRDGMLLLEQLAEERINALVLTGYGTPELEARANELDCIKFMEKGVIGKSLDALRSIIEAIFAEMETREQIRVEVRQKFSQGVAVGYVEEAAGYPLRKLAKSLNV